MRKLLPLITSILFFTGCFYQGPEYTDELDLVVTNYNDSFDFGGVTTFAIPDSIVKITEDYLSNGDDIEYVPDARATQILNRIRQNMADAGYTEVDKSANPDLIMLVSVSTTTNLFYYYDWGYWGWYYPGWYGGWGWYYPGYYYPPVASGYRSGSLFMQLTYPAGQTDDNIPVQWSGIVNGILEGGSSNLDARLNRSIDQAFAQSPYLSR